MVGTPSDHSGGDLLEQLGLHMEARVVRFALREASSIFVKLSVGLTLTFDQGGNKGGHWCSAEWTLYSGHYWEPLRQELAGSRRFVLSLLTHSQREIKIK